MFFPFFYVPLCICKGMLFFNMSKNIVVMWSSFFLGI